MPQDCSLFSFSISLFSIIRMVPGIKSMTSVFYFIATFRKKKIQLYYVLVTSYCFLALPSSLSWTSKPRKVFKTHDCPHTTAFSETFHFEIHLWHMISASTVPLRSFIRTSVAEVCLLQGILFDSTWLSFNLKPTILVPVLATLPHRKQNFRFIAMVLKKWMFVNVTGIVSSF